jgi:hypothetical protein
MSASETSSSSSAMSGLMYGLGISQLAVMIGVVLYFPPVAVQTFVYNPCVSNGTLTHACGSTQSTRVMLPLPCMVVSAAAAVFVMNTRTLVESGVMTHESSYGAEIVGHMGLWDVLFWFVVAGVHAIVVLATCSPVDAFAAGGAVYLMVHFLMRLCSPPGDPNADHGGYQQAPGGMPSVSSGITVANANILGYMAGVGVALYCVPAQYSNRFFLVLFLVVVDYFLGVGHMWDRSPNMEVIANCRLFWVCSASLCLAALYGAWRDDLLMPVAQGIEDVN